jgi:ABC-type phosphate transport system substrate-binding protein
MPGRRVTLTALLQANERDVLTYIAGHPGAVGYVSFSYWKSVTGPPALAVEGVAPTLDNIHSERYPLMRTIYMVVPEDASTDLGEFIDFVESAEGRAVLDSRIKPISLPQK